MAKYIAPQLDSNPIDLIASAQAYIKDKFPGWEAHPGNFDNILIEAIAQWASELIDVASTVPDSIMRWFGASMASLPPLDASTASVNATVTMIDNQGYTLRSGIQVGIRAAGDTLIPFEVVEDVTVPAGSTASAAGAVLLRARDAGADASGLGAAGTAAELIDPLDFVATLLLTGTTSGGVDAESDAEYLDKLVTTLGLLTPRPILPSDYAALARTVAGVYRAMAIDGYNPDYNALTANEASIETDATGWVNPGGSNANVSRSTAQAADGLASLSLSSIGAGDEYAVLLTDRAAIPGETWTAIASFRAATAGRSARVELQWRDASNVLIGTSVGANVADLTTAWTQASVAGVAPAGATKVRVLLRIVATGAAAEVHYVDKMALRRGTSTNWVTPASSLPETGNERMVGVAVIDQNGNPVPAPTKAAVDALLQSRRELTFVVSVMDPTYTTIDVNVTVKVLPGFTPSDVSARVVSAIQAYLSPANWGAPLDGDPRDWVATPIVRFQELVTLVNNVSGVDYYTVLQMRSSTNAFASSDITLGGPAPLPLAGSIVGSAV